MRYGWGAVAVIAVCALALIGCTRQVDGVAGIDRHEPGTSLSTDGYGVLVGFADAPVQLETFIEPQCPHCAHFESAYGTQIAKHVGSGQLAITYRPLTFIDESRHNDYSARVANALFLAAHPATSAIAYQDFLQNLYRHQDPAGHGPTNAALASMAGESGVPDGVVRQILAGDSGVDITKMDAANGDRLDDADPLNAGTPMVYDLTDHDVVDIQDSDWLAKLFKSV